MSFVAVMCCNDYPHSVTRSYETREEADAAGLAEKARLQTEANGLSFSREPWFHFHVLEQIERRQIMRRVDHVRAALACPKGNENRRVGPDRRQK